MNKELKYGGHTASPADYECPDGDLAATMDLWPENGALKPVLQPGTVLTLDANKKVVYVHETAAFKHYIVYDNSTKKLHWIDAESTSSINNLGSYTYYDFVSVNAIGNTVIVLRDEGMSYFLWVPGDYDEGSYKYLSDHLPDVELSFGLKGHPRLFSVSDDSHSTFNISFDGIPEGSLYADFSETNQNRITDQIMAKVNKFVKEQTVDKGYFCFPFFVRYALRLYDGTLTKHSAPILMCPSTTNGVVALWNRATGRNQYTDAECDIFLMAASLDYGCVRDYMYVTGDGLNSWTDIVKSIDVFISKPIYTYDQNGKIKNLKDGDDMKSKFIGKLFHKSYSGSTPLIATTRTEDCVMGSFASGSDVAGALGIYSEWSFSEIYSLYFNTGGTYPGETFHLPEFSEDKMGESLRTCSTFFKLCSLEISDVLATSMGGTRKDIVVPEEYLQSLVNREVMTDDYLSHDRLFAERSFVYNQRLNLCGVKRQLYKGFSCGSMFCYMSQDHNWSGNQSQKLVAPAIKSYDSGLNIYVQIKENGRVYWLQASSLWDYMGYWHSRANASGVMMPRSYGAYVFYPNVNAVKMRVTSNSLSVAYDIDLKAHDFLNGAYGLLDWDTVRSNNWSGQMEYSEDNIVDNSNKLFTSEVNNPFHYPVTNINTIGTGRILGISTAAKALSQGQFGQFPLYAFTTDGVWALEVSATTGGFSARQPITRDVCINADSITQIDDAVLFATDRGIMLISGSQTKCITEAIDGRNDEAFSLTQLPQAVTILAEAEEITDESEFNFVPFRTFLGGCGLIYDYPYQRLIIFNPAYKYAYVYSMTMKQWAMMRSGITSAVNSYPEALAMTDENKLVDFAQHIANETPTNQILVTRPLKLDAPDLLKTIDHIIQRGRFARGNVKILLYGSRDLGNWFPVFSSTDHYLRGFRGTPYKYFRIVLKCTLDDAEELAGCSIEYKTKETNQLR